MSPMNPRLLRPIASRAGFLDQFGNAAAAFGLRSLRSAYSGPVIAVRRTSDNAEADFTAREVAGGQMLAWVGASDGRVRAWYDQTGNGRHFEQTTSTDQPTVVSSGVQVTISGRPAMSSNGSSHFLRNATWVRAGSETILAATQATALGNFRSLFTGNTNFVSTAQNEFRSDTSSTLLFSTGGNSISITLTTGAPYLLFAANGPSGAAAFGENNSAIVTGTVGAINVNVESRIFMSAVGATPGQLGRYWNGRLAELIVFGESRASERASMISVMNSYYGVF
jgi:hypothetical protein